MACLGIWLDGTDDEGIWLDGTDEGIALVGAVELGILELYERWRSVKRYYTKMIWAIFLFWAIFLLTSVE